VSGPPPSRQDRLRQPGAAYLLSQVGAHSSRRWQERLRPLGLDPRQVVVLRMVAAEQGRTQRSLGPALGVPDSRIVALIDGLEERRLLKRRPKPDDRRAYALHLTAAGQVMLAKAMALSVEHESAIAEGLTESQRVTLIELLNTIARCQGLAQGGHPGMTEPGQASP
jgi:DNA-binding MarR family transcriptional regulator